MGRTFFSKNSRPSLVGSGAVSAATAKRAKHTAASNGRRERKAFMGDEGILRD
jgi:hypothetical protein